MVKETKGTVVAIKKQWWLKINTKPIRKNALDGAIFPHVIKVRYTVEGKEFVKSQWVGAGKMLPEAGSFVDVRYCEDKPGKAKVII